MLPAAHEEWARRAAPAFISAGAAAGAGLDFARLYIALWASGLNPRVTSIFRDPARQKFLQQEWDAGRGAQFGLRVRPATTSKHSLVAFGGVPAATAIDMPTSNDRRAAEIAGQLGIGSGMSFQAPDPGHFFSLGAST